MSGDVRVEELARRTDTSVDTIRFYQKRHLLPPPRRVGRIAWYGAEHVERLARIRELQRQGFSLAVIRRLVEAFRTLLPTVTTLVAHHFRSVLLEVAQEHLEAVGETSELAAASAEPGWELASS